MKKDTRTIWLSWIIGFIVTLGLWTLGFLCHGKLPDFVWIFCAAAMFFPIVALIVNIFGAKRYVNRFIALSSAEKLELIKSKQADAANDIDAVMQARHRSCVRAKVYIISLCVCIALSCFISGAVVADEGASFFVILLLFVVSSLIYRLLIVNRYEEDPNQLSESEYPALYAMAREAAEKCGVEDRIKIIATSNPSAGIASVGRTRLLFLGAILLDLFSEEELRQTLLHEFAHVADGQYACYRMEAESLLRFLTEGDTSNQGVITYLFFTLPFNKLTFENELVNAVCSRADEKRADEIITRCGKPGKFISGLAKLNTYAYFSDFSNSLPPYYESETPRADSVNILCETYKKDFEVYREQWLYMLEHELPARLDSHPSFPQRRDAVGCCDFTIEFSDPDTPYRRECSKVTDFVNKLILDGISAEDYARFRREQYLEPLKTVEEYEAGKKSYTPEESSVILDAYSGLCRYDKMAALCDEIIKTAENPYATAYALFLKGNYLLKNYDASGIELLYKAGELNSNFTLPALDEIGEFCLRMGLEEELQRYRDTYDGYVEDGMDEYSELGCINEKDKLMPEKFPDDRLPSIIDFMLTAGGGCIEEIYLVRKEFGEDGYSSIFILHFAEAAEQELCSRAYEKIFHYLDTYPDGWQYTLLVYDKPTAKILKKIPEALVYRKE